MPRAPKVCARCGNDQPCPDHTQKPWEGTTSKGFPAPVRRRILARDPICRCLGCDRCTPDGCQRPSTEADHLHESASGGGDDEANGRGMCTPCHRHRSQQHASRMRWL